MVRKRLGLCGKKVVLYAGTHGLAQGLQVVVEAAEILKAEDQIVFVLAGDGSEKSRLIEKVGKLQISNIVFLDTWPKSDMPDLLEAADVCLVTLRDLPVFHRALPSKMYEAMAMSRPLVVSAKGLAAELVTKAGCGMAVAPEDPRALAEAVRDLCQDPNKAEIFGRKGRDFVGIHFSRQAIAKRWEELLKEVTIVGRG